MCSIEASSSLSPISILADKKVLLETMAATAEMNGRKVLSVGNQPTFRIQDSLGFSFATMLLDPIHAYPALVHQHLQTSAGIIDSIERLREARVDLLRMRYLPKDVVDATLNVLPNLQIVRHQTSIASLEGCTQNESTKAIVRRNSKWKLLQRDFGEIDFQLAIKPNERLKLVELLLSWKRSWFRQNEIVARSFEDPVHIDILRSLAAHQDPEEMEIHALTVCKQPIAIEVCIPHDGVLLNHIIAVDPDFRNFGPGVLLSKLQLSDAAQRGYSDVDFLPPTSAHKSRFTQREIDLVELRVPLTLKGKLALAAFDAKSGFNRLFAAKTLP